MGDYYRSTREIKNGSVKQIHGCERKLQFIYLAWQSCDGGEIQVHAD